MKIIRVSELYNEQLTGDRDGKETVRLLELGSVIAERFGGERGSDSAVFRGRMRTSRCPGKRT